MADQPRWPERFKPSNLPPGPVSDDIQQTMLRAAQEVMTVQDVTWGDRANPLRVRGTLTLPAEEAFTRLRPQFESVGYTPLLRHEDDVDAIRALPTVFAHGESSTRTVRIAVLL